MKFYIIFTIAACVFGFLSEYFNNKKQVFASTFYSFIISQIISFILYIIFLMGSSICTYLKKEENYKKYRYSNVLELRQITNKIETKESISGFYFLIGGSFNGEKTSENYIKVFAKVNGYYRVISFPIEKLRIKINNKIEKPTLQIGYYGYKSNDSESLNYGTDFIIECPEKYLPEKLIPFEL